jgi:hypothetical protein
MKIKKVIFILMLLAAFHTQAQRTFNIVGMKTEFTAAGSDKGTFLPLKFKIAVTDSLFSFISEHEKKDYSITKRVDSGYFKVTDGLRDAFVRIHYNYPTKPIRKLQSEGYITVEDDKTMTYYYY